MNRFVDKAGEIGSAIFRALRTVFVVVLAGAAGCSALGLGTEESPKSSAGAPQGGVAYEVVIAGIDEVPDLKKRLEGASRLKSLQGEPPLTEAGLKRRLDEDIERFRSVLRAEGYYDASIESRIADGPPPLEVVVGVAAGPLYRLQGFEIVYDDEAGRQPEALPRGAADLELEHDGPAHSDAVLSAEAKLLEVLAQKGRPLASVKDRKVMVDHATRTMAVTVQVAQGPAARFGGVTFSGLTEVQERYVRRLVPWRDGDSFDQRMLAELDKRLYETELFESVVVRHSGSAGAENKLPATVDVVERKHRSVGAGLSYATDAGPGIEVFWQHRNLFGQAEKLDLGADASTIRQRLRADFTNPDYRRIDQDLLFGGELARQDNEAFRSQTVSLSTGLRREFSELWSGQAGASFEYGIVDDRSDDGDSRTVYRLLGLPLTLERDSRDDLLDPTRGTLLTFGATPYLNTRSASDSFLDLRVGGSAYLALDSDKRYVAAVRGRVESLLGVETTAIPATKRLYAGGGGSIRGYEFQTVGPLDADDDPVGGRSLAEAGAEMRFRVGESFGVVPFVEGGMVGDSSTPDLGTRPQWAAGLGFRYYTAIGPVRADIAFPINRRDGVDDRFQIYLSLGQAF